MPISGLLVCLVVAVSPNAQAAGEAIDDPALAPLPAAARRLAGLAQALPLLKAQSVQLAGNRRAEAQAAATSRAVGARIRPQVSASSTFGHTFWTRPSLPAEVKPPSPTINASLFAGQTLLDLQSWQDLRSAGSAQQASSVRVFETQRQLLQNLVARITDVARAQAVSENSRAGLRAALEVTQLTARMLQVGTAQRLDIVQAAQAVAARRRQLIAVDENSRLSRDALGFALGDANPWGLAAALSPEQLLSSLGTYCGPVVALQQRRSVQAARLSWLAAEQKHTAADYAYAPTLDASTSVNYSDAFRSPHRLQWVVGASLNVPIFDGGGRAANSDSAAASAVEAVSVLRLAERQSNLEVRQALRSQQVAGRDLQAARISRDLAAETAQLTLDQLRYGEGDVFQVVQNNLLLQTAEVELLLANFQLVLSQLNVRLAGVNCSF